MGFWNMEQRTLPWVRRYPARSLLFLAQCDVSVYVCSSGSKNIPSKPYDDVMKCEGKSRCSSRECWLFATHCHGSSPPRSLKIPLKLLMSVCLAHGVGILPSCCTVHCICKTRQETAPLCGSRPRDLHAPRWSETSPSELSLCPLM